ncbi:MAG: hypothetical protein QM765_39870 [Myxococcales bacterium]
MRGAGSPAFAGASGEQLVEHHPEGEDVGAAVGVRARSELGSHVARGPGGDGAGDALAVGEPEVEDARRALGGDHHVVGLEVAVDDAQRVGVLEPAGDLLGVAPGLGPGHAAGGDERAQRPARDVLHDQHGAAVVLLDPVDRGDVRVDHGGGGARLLEHRLALGKRAGAGAHELERHLAQELGVLGEEDRAQAALAQHGLDAVVAERRADQRGGRLLVRSAGPTGQVAKQRVELLFAVGSVAHCGAEAYPQGRGSVAPLSEPKNG